VKAEALGSRQALNRRRIVRIDAGEGPLALPLPSLLGAIIMKARVVSGGTGSSGAMVLSTLRSASP
jgi:hypothetical protein